MFEPVLLKGSYIKTLAKMKSIDPNNNSYVIYCGASKRFYCYNLGR